MYLGYVYSYLYNSAKDPATLQALITPSNTSAKRAVSGSKQSTSTKTNEKETKTKKGKNEKRSDSGTSSRKAHTNMHV